jgi:vacuolar-type H+-ATPase subunit E/Vma4
MDNLQLDLYRLNAEYSDIKQKNDELKRDRCELVKKINSNEIEMVKYKEKITHLTNMAEVENVMDYVKNIEGFDLLEKGEITIIIANMDKTDYTKYNCVRWIDLEKLVKEVINIKKKYNWTLIYLTSGGRIDTMPPTNFYKFEYKDEDGLMFIY